MTQESELLSALRKEIDKLETRLQELRVKAKLGEMDVREAIKPKIDELETDLKQAQKEFSRLNDVTSEAFDAAKLGVENAVVELSRGLERTLDILLKGRKE